MSHDKALRLVNSMLTKVDFLAAVAGRRIVDVEVYDLDSMNGPPSAGEVLIRALVLDDGTRIELTASGQIGYDDVWANVAKPTVTDSNG